MSRSFWAFDSFSGLPKLVKLDKLGPLAKGKPGKFKASREEFVANLQDYGAYDSSVVSITSGLFRDTLPVSEVAHIAFLRLDGKLYEATWDSLIHLYEKVIPGGYVYVNDYYVYNGCRQAVDDFRELKGLTPTTASKSGTSSGADTSHINSLSHRQSYRPLHEVYDDWRGQAVRGAVWWIK